jgi:WD40 repeat protein
MNNLTRFLLAVSVTIPFSASSPASAQEAAKPAAPAAAKINFQDHILPIFRAKCGTCHGVDQAKGGLVLDSYGAAILGGASGAVVEPGELDSSRLWALVSHKEQPVMPPKEPKLPDETLALIKQWIDGGALENKDSVVKVKKKSSFSLSTTAITGAQPEGPPPMPENLPTEPVAVSLRGNAVTALAASPWAPLVAVSGHKQVLMYNLNDMLLAAVLPFPEGTVHVLKFSRNGSLLLAAGGRGGQTGRVIVFDVKSGKRVFELGSEIDSVLAADISPNHGMIALGGPKKIVRVFSTADGEQVYELKKHTDWITTLEFSPDGVLLATGDRGNGLIVWEADTGREFYTLAGHTGTMTGVSWRVDSNVLASSSEDTTVRLWEMNNGTQIKTWGAHGGGAANVEFLRDGRLVSTGRDRVTKLWNQDGAQVVAFPAHGDLGLRVTFANTAGMALAGDWTGAVRVFTADGKDRAILATNPAPLVARIDEATKVAAASQATAGQTVAQVAALQKAMTDKKALADAAVKLAADSQAAATAAQTELNAAVPQVAIKTETVKAVETTIAAANAALAKALAEKTAAEAAADKKDVPAKTAAFQAAEQIANAVKTLVDPKIAEKAAADKAVVDATAKVKTTTDQAVVLKAAADKAVAEAVPTPDQLKALEAATAAAKQTADAAVAAKALLERLKAEQTRSAQASAAQASAAK